MGRPQYIEIDYMYRLASNHTFLKFTIKSLSMLMIVAAIMNCSQRIVQVNDQEFNKCLPFIRDGITSKQEILNRLGGPINSYEGGLIITYLVSDSEGSKQKMINCEKKISDKNIIAVYNLVLVFGQNNVLKRHSLVRVR